MFGAAIILMGAVYALAQMRTEAAKPQTIVTKWEYLVETLHADGGGDLKDHGEQGWELVSVTPIVMRSGPGAGAIEANSHSYFKRPKQN
jgi:hypothetical protein